MTSDQEISEALQEILTDILAAYEEKVPAEGAFNDFRVKRQVRFGDPATASPGLLELTVMAMDEKINPANRALRFLAIRVRKSPRGGVVSSTCFHGTTEKLRGELEREQRNPAMLVMIVQELLFGLPEETNPDMWR